LTILPVFGKIFWEKRSNLFSQFYIMIFSLYDL
jgi:hypothetical protein